jgi:hypothetical protein
MTVKKLTRRSKTSKVSRAPSFIAVSIKTVDAEQTASDKHRALRLFCRAMIQLYLKDNTEKSEYGKRLGVL